MAAIAGTETQYVGVDISKDKLDVFVHPQGDHFELPRTVAGIEELAHRLKNHAPEPPVLVAMEATGGLETLVTAGLAQAGLPVVVVNPKQVHNFAKALGFNAKTDVLDACVIARFAAAIKPEPRALPDAESQALSALMTRRRQVTQMIAAEKNRALAAPLNKVLQKSIARILQALEHELEQLDHDIDGMIKASPLWLEKEELLTSVPGIGKVIARTLLAEMPELGRLDRRAVAALAGLAPWAR
jgi:transposase